MLHIFVPPDLSKRGTSESGTFIAVQNWTIRVSSVGQVNKESPDSWGSICFSQTRHGRRLPPFDIFQELRFLFPEIILYISVLARMHNVEYSKVE